MTWWHDAACRGRSDVMHDGTVQRWEACVRCRVCRCPRCGSASDPDPCMERRHHDGLHITLHGRFEPVGGYLPPEADEKEAPNG